METGRNLEHTTERHQRGFKVPMELGSLLVRMGNGIMIQSQRSIITEQKDKSSFTGR